MAHIQTVTGAISPESVRRVMHHEHLLSLVPGPWLHGGAGSDEVANAITAIEVLPELGFDTVVDLSPHGVVGRSERSENVSLLKEIAERSTVNVVAGSSVYLESFSPAWTIDSTLAELTARFVRDATVGLEGTDIRVGIFGEQATSLGQITEHEEKCLRAAVRATRETGLALTTHTTHGTMPIEQITIVQDEGADLSRLLIGHLDIPTEESEIVRALDLGANVAFDTIGKENWDFVTEPLPSDLVDGEYTKRAYHRADLHRAERIARLIDRGYASQILLALDLTGAEVYLNPRTHGRWGYAYLGAVFVPLLRELGVSEPDLETMLRTNPVRLLSIAD